ncbi:MAG TPA: MFS transporter [Verrucomicrobiae bacterium]|nr:MFS transporter [Verrucomicrobiae bacterium]
MKTADAELPKPVREQKVTWRNPWSWVSTLYLAEGLPYVVVMTVAVVMYKGLGISNTDIALYTSWLYLPWVIKPLWSPVVDILKTRRVWIWGVQLVLGAGLAGVALTLHASRPFQYSLAFLWLLAFSSATHDIAIDGFYMLATTEKEQAFFVGIRSTFYRVAMVFGQGVLVILAGLIQEHTGLAKVDLHIAAKPGVALVDSIPSTPLTLTPLEGDLRVVMEPATLEIAPVPRAKQDINALVSLVKSNNVEHAFYGVESAKTEPGALDKFFGFLGKPFHFIGLRSGPFLRQHFGPETKAKSSIAGNIGIAALHLSRPPGRDVVVTLGSRVGFGLGSDADKSFSVAEGSRFVFNDQNWNQPALAAIQLDPKVKTAVASLMEIRSGNLPLAWSFTFFLLAAMFLVFCVYHKFILPYPLSDKPGSLRSLTEFWKEFFRTFAAFFKKEQIGWLLLFLLLFRFAEAQLTKMVVPFLLDGREAGGLGLTTSEVGLVYGTVGIAALTAGGLLGGMLAAKNGLKFWLWWMVIAIHLPDAVFIYLAYTMPYNFWVINLCVAIEQFGYGFGFTAYMLYMIYIARGKHATSHYAICTGFMALGMLLPGMFSGWLEDIIGYQHFFVWVLLSTIPGFLVVATIPLDPEFGKKNA